MKKIINFFFTKEFNHVDAVGISMAASLLSKGHHITALIAILTFLSISIIGKRLIKVKKDEK